MSQIQQGNTLNVYEQMSNEELVLNFEKVIKDVYSCKKNIPYLNKLEHSLTYRKNENL